MNRTHHAGFAVFGRFAVFALLATLMLAGWPPARAEDKITAAPQGDSCQRAKFHVVIDVGHTLAIPGAMSARGVTEYAFNLQLSRDILQALHDAGFAEAELLITTTAPFRGLFERAIHANAEHADLFLAIHHDSVPDRMMRTWEYEGQQQHYDDDYPGYALFISNDNVARAGSLDFARALGMALQARGLPYTPHYTLPIMGHRQRVLVDADAGVYRYDQLIVLRQTRMPAVLLEAGSIVNRQEELELATPQRRALISAAVAAAVEDFCAARSQTIAQHVDKHPAAPKALVQRVRATTSVVGR